MKLGDKVTTDRTNRQGVVLEMIPTKVLEPEIGFEYFRVRYGKEGNRDLWTTKKVKVQA